MYEHPNSPTNLASPARLCQPRGILRSLGQQEHWGFQNTGLWEAAPNFPLPSPFFFFHFKDFIYLFLEREEGEREREGEGEKHPFFASHTRPDWGLNPQPRHVLCLRIEPVTFCFVGRPSNQPIHPGRGSLVLVSKL